MNNSIYESIILSKSNIQIPLFKSGRSVDSRYFPEKEAEKIIAEISNSYKIFLVLGTEIRSIKIEIPNKGRYII